MKLEPCPFCGSGVLHKNNPEKMGYTFFVSCGLCDCRGACLPTEQGAVEAWNTRAAAIPEGYVVVPVEPTEEWIANMRKGTIEPQGMDAQAKIIEGLRRNYKRWIAAAKDGAANVAAHTRKPVVNGYLLEACPKCGCFGSESPCAVCKLRAASVKEQS